MLHGNLDIEKAFSKVLHDGLLIKNKFQFPALYYQFLKSCLQYPTFFVKIQDIYSIIYITEAVVTQSSVLGPV